MDCCKKNNLNHTETGVRSDNRKNIFVLCVLGVVTALVTVRLFEIPIGNILYFGVFLACPLMHVFMMRGPGNDKK